GYSRLSLRDSKSVAFRCGQYGPRVQQNVWWAVTNFWERGSGRGRTQKQNSFVQYTNTNTAACSAAFTTSSNFGMATGKEFGSLSFAETSGIDSRKLSRKLLLTA